MSAGGWLPPYADTSLVTSVTPTAYPGASEDELRRAPELHPEVERLIVETRERVRRGLPPRDRIVSFALAAGFLVASAAFLVTTDVSRHPGVATVLLYTALYGLLSRIGFEVGVGSAIPVQLILVPMLFVLPLPWVPFCVAAGYLLRDPRGLRRMTAPRAALRLVSSWHALGPAVVLALAADRSPHWSAWPLYVAALAAQFAVDFVVTWVREAGLGARHSPLRTQGLAYAVDAGLAPIGLLVAFASVRHPPLVLIVLPLVGLLALFAREREQRIDAALELGHAYRGTAFLLGDVVEADDAYTGEHSRDVVSLTLEVATILGLDARQRRNAEFVALLHDVGKIRIPTTIINKAGPLDPDERAVIETHTIEGEAMLKKVGGLLGEIGHIVRSCHERWDGKGYPDGLAGEAIPLTARIVCCTDAFSAMTTDRPYRKARSHEEALAELRNCAGTHFDPAVVEAVGAVVDAYDVVASRSE
jgi:HD-GYP domain-containing protein (c-di-GMP phosphodiesterase class II)